MKKIILFYGSFDPIHEGHIKIALQALNLVNASKLYFGLNKTSKSKNLSPFSDRKAMLKQAIKEYKQFRISNIAFDYDHIDSTYDKILSLSNSKTKCYILIGEDQLLHLKEWYKFSILKEKFTFIVASRNKEIPISNDYLTLNNNILDISSTQIRNGDFSYLDTKVKNYIIKHQLYLINRIEKYYSKERLNHVLSVKDTALLIYKTNKSGLNKNKVVIASLLHDIAKELNKEELVKFMNEYYKEHLNESINVYHQYVGEYLAKKDFFIEDIEILDAIKYHTTGKEKMTKLAKLIFIADKIEPTRKYDTSKLIEISSNNLNKGFLTILKNNANYLKDKNIDYKGTNTEKTINYYLKGDK